MSEIISAEAKDGLIHAQDADGRQYEIWIDDRGIPHSGRMNMWLVDDHVVEILLPVNQEFALTIPLRVTVRHEP